MAADPALPRQVRVRVEVPRGSFAKRMDVQDIAVGTYVLKVHDAKGMALGTARFTIER